MVNLIFNNGVSPKDRLSFLSTTTHFQEIKNHVLWHVRVKDMSKIQHLPFFDQFTIFDLTNETCGKCPKHVSLLIVTKDIFVPKLKLHQEQTLPDLHTVLIEHHLFHKKINTVIRNRPTIHTLYVNLFGEFEHIEWPKNLVELHLLEGKRKKTQRISKDVLPSTLQKLVLYNYKNPIVSLPKNLTYLDLGQNYRAIINPGLLPKTLRYLKLGDRYNDYIFPGELPMGLEELVFGKEFDQHLEDGSIPSSVKKVTFGDSFNRTLYKEYLPEGVIFLKLGAKYGKFIDEKTLPSTLKELHVPMKYQHPIPNNHFEVVYYVVSEKEY